MDESEEESADAHPYTVNVKEQAAEPLRFHQLPRELQSEVLKRTRADFEVAYEVEISVNELGLGMNDVLPGRRLHFVPVVLRYQFKLQRRLADGPVMKARISRSVDPAFQQRALWHELPPQRQRLIEQRAAKVFESLPFSELFFDEIPTSTWVFCFVHAAHGRRFKDAAPRWTRFARNSEVLDEVRAKMERLFRLPLLRLEPP